MGLAAAARLGRVVGDPADADAAVLRLDAPYEPRPGGFEAHFHAGSLVLLGRARPRPRPLCPAPDRRCPVPGQAGRRPGDRRRRSRAAGGVRWPGTTPSSTSCWATHRPGAGCRSTYRPPPRPCIRAAATPVRPGVPVRRRHPRLSRPQEGGARLLVGRNYGAALLSITCLALPLGHLAALQPLVPLLLGRLLQTLLGVAVALAAAVLPARSRGNASAVVVPSVRTCGRLGRCCWSWSGSSRSCSISIRVARRSPKTGHRSALPLAAGPSSDRRGLG